MAKNSFRERMEHYVQELVNPMSYYDWINQNTTLAGVPFTCDRYPFQKDIINDMSLELHCIKPSQIGLPISLKTPIFTPEGFKPLGDIQVNDWVYTPEGKKAKVVYLSPIQTDSPCYEITFCDGTTIVADENHRWYVHSDKAFNLHGLYGKTGRIPVDSDFARQGRITTKAIFENYKGKGARTNANIFYIPCAKPMQTKGWDLKVNPYFLGLWLGNGSKHTGTLTTHVNHVEDIKKYFTESGFQVVEIKTGKGEEYLAKTLSVKNSTGSTEYLNLKKEVDVTREKYFDPNWLLLSIPDRLELLQGLIDSDGNISKLGRVEFYNTSKSLVDGFYVLAASLGFKPRKRMRKIQGLGIENTLKNGHVIKSKKDIYMCHFVVYSDSKISKLQEKLKNLKDRKNGRPSESFQRRIVKVEPVESEPVRCIMVDDPEHQFVCSEAFITTSNTEVQLRKALAFVARNPHRTLIYTMPDENMRKRVFQARVLPILTEDKVFHGLNAAGKKPIRSIETTEINNSFMMMFPANEKAATSQPADVVFNDEVDLSDPQILALFNSRVQGSDLRMIHNYSTPTYDGLGISALYETSDQHEYLFKCPHCGHWQLPTFNTKFIRIPNLPIEASDDLTKFDPIWVDKYGINPLDAYSVCSKCDRRVTYGDAENHRWVSRHPHRSNSRGYRISPFSTRNLDAAYVFSQLLKYQLQDNMKGFHNTVLGITHESSDERLSETLLRTLFTAMSDFYMDHNGVPHFIGIDMGKVCHITIGRAESIGKVKTVIMEAVKVEELEARFRYYCDALPIAGGFIDRLPLITESNKIRNISDFAVMPMQYGRNSGGMIVTPKNDEYGNLDYVEAHRTLHLDKFANAIRSGYITFAGYGTQKETIISHLRAMVRVFEEDKDGVEKVPVWKKKDKNDHYFHSMAYMYQAVVQFYDGYSYLDTEQLNSSIILESMNNFVIPERSISILGGR